MLLVCVMLALGVGVSGPAQAQSFGSSTLDFGGLGGVSNATSLEFGPDGRLYVMQVDGTLDIFTIIRNGPDDYVVIEAEELTLVRDIPNHDDDGSPDTGSVREATGITVVGSATNPVVYATSSDARIGGPSGDKDLDTNSGTVTRLAWIGADLDDPSGYWESVDLVRGLPRSEENHATNGLEFVTIAGNDYLLVAQGGHTNAGSPSTNFTWTTEYALSAAVLAIDLAQLAAMPVQSDGVRDYVYDLPTVDDPTRANVSGVTDPNAPGYDGVDVNDPFGGNDGLNQARLVPGGPVQIFSPGYRNTYDLVVTASGAVYVTDNGANGGWGGYPDGEGPGGGVTNDYRVGEPGSTGPDPVDGEAQVNNSDHLSLVTTDVQSYVFGSFYGGHPAPIRANPAGAGLFARGTHSSDPGDQNGNTYTDDWFRTQPYDPSGSGEATSTATALPADWPPVPLGLADPVQGDYRNPGGANPDGPNDAIVTTWSNNTNGIDEYTASNFGGAMQGDLIAGKSGGALHRVQLDPDGSLDTLTQNWVSNLGGNPLGVTANGDADPFPGTIWVATFNTEIVVLEPQDFVVCLLPEEPGYDPQADNDSDGYTNEDEEDNGTDACNGGSQPNDFDKAAGLPFVSDLNDDDDDADGIPDASDTLQIGNPVDADSDAFPPPVVNELFSDNPVLGGYLGLGFAGFMNDGSPNPNWLDWIDVPGDGPNPNDVLGGAVGAMTMQMTEGTAVGGSNTQAKGFQYGTLVDLSTGGFRVDAQLLNFAAGEQLYPFVGDAELGIQMGDGTQSNFMQLVVTHAGVEFTQELGDVPGTTLVAPVAVIDRPVTRMRLRLDVDSTTGGVDASYAIDAGAFAPVGTLAAGGAILDAIQSPATPIHVGLIGTSNVAGDEVEGTWDYLNVIGSQPTIEAPIGDVVVNLGVASLNVDLHDFFEDNDGDVNLTYQIVSNSNGAVAASILANVLSFIFPASPATATIVVRATDGNGLFVEQTFDVSVTNPVAIYRLNAGGAAIAALDGGIAWEQDTTAANSTFLSDPGSNSQAAFSMNAYVPGIDLATTPTAIFSTERYDGSAGLPDMTYSFPVDPGSYEVRLYMGNGWSGAASPGQRIFSVDLEGVSHQDLTDLDLTATFGHQVGGLVTHVVEVSDGALDIVFSHGAANNPMLNGIEIIGNAAPGETPIAIAAIGTKNDDEGALVNLPVIASGGDTGTYSFEATGLPAGLQIEPTTGLIFGTVATGASASSPYPVQITVDDNDGNALDVATAQFTWNVTDPNALSWIDLDEDEGYTGRHECSFVQAGDRFYLFGGRENPTVLDTYDFASDTWSVSAAPPAEFNHFQATEYQGLVWVIGAFETNSFPNEDPADAVFVYDPANDVWMQGPLIPVARRRGGAGLVVYDDKFYVVGGNTIGHNGGYVAWFDEFDPATGTWTPLTDAPHPRDHFHAVVVGDSLYAIGGRLSGGPGGTFEPLVPEIDVYDFTTDTWSTLPIASDIPTPRAASGMAYFDGLVMVMGGEDGSQAWNVVEGFDPLTGDWQSLPPMHHTRHGTQAVVSGGGVYILAGSPNQGGGNQKNMEVYGADTATGVASSAGQLDAPLQAFVTPAGATPIALEHVAGNEGVVVTGVALSGQDAADFAIASPSAAFGLIAVGGARIVSVDYVGLAANATATLDVTHSGGVVTSVQLAPEPGVLAGFASGLLSLAALTRRRASRRRATAST